MRLHLKQPNAPFVPNVLGYTFIAPKHVWEKVGADGSLKTPADYPNDEAIGSGPFKLGEWKRGEYLFLKANADWWTAPKIEGVYWLVVPSLENQMGMVDRGEADLLGWYIDRKQGDTLAKNPDLTVVSTPSHGLHEIRMHVNLAPLDDPEHEAGFTAGDRPKDAAPIFVFGGAGTVANNSPIMPINKFWCNPLSRRTRTSASRLRARRWRRPAIPGAPAGSCCIPRLIDHCAYGGRRVDSKVDPRSARPAT